MANRFPKWLIPDQSTEAIVCTVDTCTLGVPIFIITVFIKPYVTDV